MRIYIGIIISLAIFSSCFYNKTCQKQSCRYYDYINMATIEIINGHYNNAIELHKQGFATGHKGFSDDFYNALKLASITGDAKFAYVCAMQLAKRGICIELLEGFSILREDKTAWAKLQKIALEKSLLRNAYRDSLNKLHNDDQVARQIGANLVKTDSIIFLRFLNLYKKFGFPSEEKIGRECTDNKTGFWPPPYYTFLGHLVRRQYQQLHQILLAALKNNEIPLEYFVDYYNQLRLEPGKYYPVTVAKLDDGNYYSWIMSDSLKNAVNRNRSEIGMPSVDEQTKVIKYVLLHGDGGFRLPYTLVDVYPSLPESYISSHFEKLHFED